MGRVPLAFALGAVVGAVTMWAVVPRSSSTEARPVEPVVATPPAPEPVTPRAVTASSAPRPVAPAPIVQVSPAAAPPSLDAAQTKELEELRARVAALEAQQKQSVPDRENAAFPTPPNLNPRFSEATLRENLGRALEEAGFSGAQVASVDCTEYPCIVWFDGAGDRGTWDKLKTAPTFASNYGHDSASTWGWSNTGKDGQLQQHFGIALLPDDDPNKHNAAMTRRIHDRAQAMEETFKTE